MSKKNLFGHTLNTFCLDEKVASAFTKSLIPCLCVCKLGGKISRGNEPSYIFYMNVGFNLV